VIIRGSRGKGIGPDRGVGRLGKFSAMFSVKEGDQIVMTYLPGKGTAVSVKGTEKGVIEGKDFADALFAVWLGNNPVQEDLKKALLTGKS
jgi:hypothetical protein